MTFFIKRVVSLVVLCFFILGITSCGTEGEAKAFIRDFFEAVEAGEYEEAATFLHPDLPADLEKYFGTIEDNEGVDFSDGINIEKFVSFSEKEYDAEVNGSSYKMLVRTRVSGIGIRFDITIVKNANGYGIYKFRIDG